MTYESNDRFLDKAKAEAVQAYNASYLANNGPLLSTSDVYVVWFSKTLKNWKALVSTDLVNGVYMEVTYDGSNEQAYIDTYSLMSNCCIPDRNLKG